MTVIVHMQEYAFFLLGVRRQTFTPLNESVALSPPAPEPLWNRTICVKLNAFLFIYSTCDRAVTVNFTVCPSITTITVVTGAPREPRTDTHCGLHLL